jgi:general secretion pathway protein G
MIYYFLIQRIKTHKRLELLLKREVVEGFTILELLTVIAVVGALSAIAIPAYNDHIEKAKETRAIADILALQKDIEAFEIINKTLPDALDDLARGDFEDPWGNPYRYLNFAKAKGKGKGKMRKDRFLVPINSTYDLYSMGKDGKSSSPLTAKSSYDDIIRANDGGYVGPAHSY